MSNIWLQILFRAILICVFYNPNKLDGLKSDGYSIELKKHIIRQIFAAWYNQYNIKTDKMLQYIFILFLYKANIGSISMLFQNFVDCDVTTENCTRNQFLACKWDGASAVNLSAI